MSRQHIDEIYDWVDFYCQTKQFNIVDRKLLDLQSFSIDDDSLLAWLVSTLPAKSKFKNRKFWYDEGLRRMGEEVMRGLE